MTVYLTTARISERTNINERSMAVRATVIAQIPTPLVEKWMQHIRDFDVAHEGCHFEIFVATEQNITEIQRLLDNLNPPLQHRKMFRRKPEAK